MERATNTTRIVMAGLYCFKLGHVFVRVALETYAHSHDSVQEKVLRVTTHTHTHTQACRHRHARAHTHHPFTRPLHLDRSTSACSICACVCAEV